ncbi:hypothetical protein MCHIJ_41920 [Mycolicibacterium chitae]|uniref:Putative membrane protein (DUF2207) n=1 Tax=Mycolicibacterium chitae TaxID=1792 RepID=A0A448I783_MYCCI|nr:hypothetical protein MCHIJ_41920 [Mycolicibacterium chitae]VEG48381.1 putative membrane protein (DUF2207) [Mycolicibacterium chitae]
MGWFGRGLRWLTAAIVVALAVLWPLVFTGESTGAPASDPVTITDYRADYHVDADGNLDATETITARFPGDRHGIFRYWDVTNPNSPRVRQEPTITSIRMDDGEIPYELQWSGRDRFRVAKIGDPDRYLDYGEHVFEIRYTVPGVLDPGDTGAQFYWNVIAPGWDNVIERAEITVTLPAAVTGVQCWVGRGTGTGTPCPGIHADATRLTILAAGLAPRTPVTVRAGWTWRRRRAPNCPGPIAGIRSSAAPCRACSRWWG